MVCYWTNTTPNHKRWKSVLNEWTIEWFEKTFKTSNGLGKQAVSQSASRLNINFYGCNNFISCDNSGLCFFLHFRGKKCLTWRPNYVWRFQSRTLSVVFVPDAVIFFIEITVTLLFGQSLKCIHYNFCNKFRYHQTGCSNKEPPLDYRTNKMK